MTVQAKGITKYIGEDCEMRGLQPNTCFDIPDRACDKCKTAQQTAEKIYNLFCEFAADVRKNTVKELQQLTIEYFCEMAEKCHVQLTQFDIPELRDNFDKYFKRYGFSVYDIVRDDDKLRDEIYTDAANDILKNIGEMYVYDYTGDNVQIKTLSWFKWLCENHNVKVDERVIYG